MISKAEMMPMILDACPSFEGKWLEFLEDWRGDPDPPLYLALSDLARHLINLLASNDVGAISKVFSVVERWLVEGNPFVAEAATIGLLEDLQNTHLHKSTEPDQFRPYLQPETIKWWDKLYAF